MNLYKCRIRITETHEGDVYVQTPTLRDAKDPLWIEHGDHIADIVDELHRHNTRCQVLFLKKVEALQEVPPEMRDTIPWYHPKYERPADDTIAERFAPPEKGAEDEADWIDGSIQKIEESQAAAAKEIARLKKLKARWTG